MDLGDLDQEKEISLEISRAKLEDGEDEKIAHQVKFRNIWSNPKYGGSISLTFFFTLPLSFVGESDEKTSGAGVNTLGFAGHRNWCQMNTIHGGNNFQRLPRN